MNILNKFKDINILVIGDIMLDHYIIGEVNRISPEAPVPVLDIKSEKFQLGGAGNVIKNLTSLGCNIYAFSIIGKDDYTNILMNLLKEVCNVDNIWYDERGIVTRKTRFITESGDQLLRTDIEKKASYSNVEFLFDLDFDKIDVIVVSDYNKGVITDFLMSEIKTYNIPIIVDPKPQNSKLYDDVFMITPNSKEYDEMSYVPKVSYILKTLGKDGMLLIDNINDVEYNISGSEVKVYNVSGAGDVVISIMSACIAIGMTDYKLISQIANEMARYSVIKPGTSVVTQNEFIKAIEKVNNKRLK